MSDAAIMLEARRIVKRFPGVVALKGVTFDLRLGEIHALCGENGAGKSTLIKVLAGVYPQGTYEGEIWLNGRPVAWNHVTDAEERGLAVIYQELALVPTMSVGENIFLGKEPTRCGLVDWLAIADKSRRVLRRFAIDLDPATKVGRLGVGHQQLVAIAKALARESRILILDEPTAALSQQEVAALMQILRDLRQHGISCIYISHKLDEVMALADRVTVLRDGESIITFDTDEASKAAIIRHMVGREITELFPRRQSHAAEPRLTVRDLNVAGPDGTSALRDISFDVRGGEVLGLGGLMGAGRTELLMHLFGAWGQRQSGKVELEGQPLDVPTPRQAISRGLVLVSEDRKRYGLVQDQTIGFNLSLSSLKQGARAPAPGWLVDRGREFQNNRRIFESLRIKARGLDTPVRQLSGGNQQKVVLGKALLTGPRVIFLDEPTRGIDVGAKLEVYELINRLTEEGHAVVLVSSELPELMGMSDRIIMLHEGAIGGVFERAQATAERLMAAAMGQELTPAKEQAS